eukprot:1349111-Amorphochlora_amoeboformis.AAC.1
MDFASGGWEGKKRRRNKNDTKIVKGVRFRFPLRNIPARSRRAARGGQKTGVCDWLPAATLNRPAEFLL